MPVFSGTAAADRIVGGADTDQIYGLDGNDALYGLDGNDLLNGGLGDDILIGGLGNDTYYVGAAGDQVVERAGEGTDRVLAWVSHQLAANVEILTLAGMADINGFGNALDNIIVGNAGNNVLNGGAGNDVMAGGAGNDVYDVGATGDVVNEGANAGYDRVRASVSYTLSANVEELDLTGTASINGTGNALANTVIGNAGANVLTGGAGDDVLIGGAGGDQMIGGVGNDIYDVDAVGDRVIEAAGQGVDLVRSSISYSLGPDVENLTLTGSGNINGIGNVGDNLIIGNAGNNRLSGGAGDDRLSGGDGDDVLRGGGGMDYVAGGSGDDTFFIGQIDLKAGEIYDGGDGYDVFAVDDGVLGTINLVGVTLHNFERLVGRFGTVQLRVEQFVSIKEIYAYYVKIYDEGDIGLIGPDVSLNTLILSDFGNSVVLGPVNSGFGRTIIGGLGNDTVVSSDFGEAINGGGGDDRLIGGAGADRLSGDDGRDEVTGGNGDDILVGGRGDDHLSGGLGADLFKFLSMADGVDTIDDFTVGQGDRLYFGFFPEFDLLPSTFEYRGSAAFTGHQSAEARFENGRVFVDMDGNGVADIAVKLNGITDASQLHQSDFVFWWEM